MIAAPAFQLPACPVCSSLVRLDRPFWKLAKNSSIHRRCNCWTFVGCEHSAEVAPTGKVYDDLEIIELVEGAWVERCAELFAARVAGWPTTQVEKFKKVLEDRAFVPGQTLPLNFTPEGPAQQETQTKR